jgi:hypothetical protein
MESKTNDLLVGIVVSGLLSLFVNFPLLTRSYEMLTGFTSSFPSAPDRQYRLLFALGWFFFFAFILFILKRADLSVGEQTV